jgi:outer membrane protein assembly factor BamD (BamD/ComL family)
MKLLTSVLVGLLLITGCSSKVKKELKYDELDLMIYQQCLDNLKVPTSGSAATPDQRVKAAGYAKTLCEEYLPLKK